MERRGEELKGGRSTTSVRMLPVRPIHVRVGRGREGRFSCVHSLRRGEGTGGVKSFLNRDEMS